MLDSLQVNPAQTRVQRYEKKIQGNIKISLLKTVKKGKTKAGKNFPGPCQIKKSAIIICGNH